MIKFAKRLWVAALTVALISLSLSPVHAQADGPLAQTASVRVDDRPLDAVAVSPDGRWAATGGRDALIRLWDMDAGTRAPVLTLAGHEERITGLVFIPGDAASGRAPLLASAGADFTVRAWDIATLLDDPAAEVAPVYTLEHHTEVIMGLAISPDGRVLASGGRDGLIWLGDPRTGDTFATLDQFGSPVWALAFHPLTDDGTLTLVSGGDDGSVWLWGLGEALSLRRWPAHTTPVMSLAFSADGERLAAGSMDGLVRVWPYTEAGDMPDSRLLTGHLAPVTGLGYSAAGEMLVSASLDGTVRAWDAISGTERALEAGNNLPLTALAARDTRLLTVGTEGMLAVWTLDEAPIIAARRSNTVTARPAAPAQTAAQTQNQTEEAASGTRLSIPVAGINSAITQFPLDNAGSWAINPWERQVGHLQGTAWLGESGNTVLGGHSRYPNGNPGVFLRLYDVRVGDYILVTEDGQERRYVVSAVRVVRYDDLTVLYPTPHSRLTLITCDVPSFNPIDNVYYERLVIVADRVP